MSYIKKLIVQLEDSDGKLYSTEIDGIYVTEIEVKRQTRSSFYDRLDYRRYIPQEPDEITIKMLSYGDIWVGATARPQNQRNLASPPRQLVSKQKQLPAHNDERKS